MVPGGPLIPDRPRAESEDLPAPVPVPAPVPTTSGGGEALAGAVLVSLSLAAAVVVRFRPGPNRVDVRGFAAIPKNADSAILHRITDLGLPAAPVIGTLLAAAVVIRRDRWRAAACVAGPFLTAVLVEYVGKPLVARRYLGVLSYPSGNVADLAAVVTALAVAVPRWIRPAVIAAGAVAVGLMIVAVIGLRWHYPTDALAGAVLGVGVVLLVDGAVHLLLGNRGPDPAPAHQR